MNENLSKIQRDLLLLIKGQYGVFNDASARTLIAKLFEPHWLISFKLCMDLPFQCREMLKALLVCIPDFLQNERSLFAMIDAFATSPEKGHEFLYGELGRIKIRERVGQTDTWHTLIELGPLDPSVKARVYGVTGEIPETTVKH